ncbi:MAG: substrate-binding domain-containing protein, partial [Chitinispirillia bacterium]
PEKDPAGIRGLKDAKKALSTIASKRSGFISRGDDSGTHKKEMKLWKAASIEPSGKWYIEAGQGMGSVLQMANEKKAYTMADRGTFLAFSKKIDLVVLCEGDPILSNPYGVMAVNPEKHNHASYTLAMAYIGWVTSQEGQKIIRDFGKDKFGQPLFKPTAIKY